MPQKPLRCSPVIALKEVEAGLCGKDGYAVERPVSQGIEGNISTCDHTLFIATDEGLEYCADRINKDELVDRHDAEDLIWHDRTGSYGLWLPSGNIQYLFTARSGG